MKLDQPLHRRRFFQISAAAAVSGNALLACSGGAGRWRFLTPEEAALVDSISEQIIPEDQDPGGKSAGAANFIDRQLSGPYKRFRKTYREGLAKVEQTSLALYRKRWSGLSFGEQTALLTKLEKNEAPGAIWDKGASARFFGLIRDHCMQGFYGSPRHGGNRNYVSYKMIGIAYPQVLGRKTLK